MNLNAYDNVKEEIDKTKTWINIKKKVLLSREINIKPYNCLIKRYNPDSASTSYFIAMLNNPPADRKCKSTTIDDYGRLKVSLASIWKDTYLAQLESDCNIVVNLAESDDDGDIYLLDV